MIKPIVLAILPEATWFFTVAMSIVMAIITHLVNRNIKKQDEKIQQLEEKIRKLESDIDKLWEDSRDTNDKINDVNMKILTDMNGIRVNLAVISESLKK